MLCCDALHSKPVLCRAVLCCAVLCRAVPCCAVLCCAVLYKLCFGAQYRLRFLVLCWGQAVPIVHCFML